jgi:hypothetical protein
VDPPGSSPLFIPGLDDLTPEATTAFLMDRHEVTNAEFKKFVDAGGYADPKYWTQPFVEGPRTLSSKDAMERFVDRTGRPGPATWEVGTYPDGHGTDPVAGVSWYEAAAYAAWAGKSLPTVFHWNRVAFTLASSRTIPLANLAGKALVPVGTTKSMNRWGVSDLAGNVREWTWNEAGHGLGRFILGGGWNDPDYAFADAFAQPAFDRAPTNGFRCIKFLDKDANEAALHRTLDRPFRDFHAEKPVDDATFAMYLRQFAYDKRTAGREDRGREANAARRAAEDHVQCGLRWRADDGVSLLAARREAPLADRGRLPRIRRDRHAVERIARPGARGLPPEIRARDHASHLQGDLRARRRSALGLRFGNGDLSRLRDHVGERSRALDRLHRDAPGSRCIASRLLRAELGWGARSDSSCGRAPA